MFLAGIMIGLVKLALVDGFKHHLHMTEELLWSSLVEDGDGEVHVIGHLDYHGAVLAFDDILVSDELAGSISADDVAAKDLSGE